MPCTRPLKGYYSKTLNPTGKRSVVWNPRDGFIDKPINLPCGNCGHCRWKSASERAARCVHEASLFQNNCFLTLTYNPQFLPENGVLDYNAPVLFMKRLRKAYGEGIRSYGCAEYGEQFSRPHYHLLIFNHDFTDKVLHKESFRGDRIYRSKSLEELWPFGFSTIGALTAESAAYVSRYVMKKWKGKNAPEKYTVLDDATGELIEYPPERSICISRRPGIGRAWFEKYKTDVFPSDEVIINGQSKKPPRYYDKLFSDFHPESYLQVKRNRIAKVKLDIKLNPNEYTPERLATKERFQELFTKQYKRGYENDF